MVNMTGGLSDILKWLTGAEVRADRVRELLQVACRARATIDLLEADAILPRLLSATVVRVGRNDLLVSQPVGMAGRVKLLPNSLLRFVVEIEGRRWLGTSRLLGRDSAVTEGGGAIFGYRLALPSRLTCVWHQGAGHAVEQLVCVSAHLRLLADRPVAVIGCVEELSPGGMLLHTRTPADQAWVGRHGTISARLPDPAGAIEAPVTVRCAEPADASGRSGLIGVSFDRAMPEIEALLSRMSPRVRAG
ncbi:MAG: hypothetical protein HRU76_08120 [Phycisphaeraceae bacterium]|nr:MAG: hypothetical protein HRU76_08120 [Phycisphaeraceae bacterium]